MRNNANSLDLHMDFRTELESIFLEAQLFAVRLFFFFPSRTYPHHHMLFISVANKVEMVQTASSFPTLCTAGMWQVKVASHKADT